MYNNLSIVKRQKIDTYLDRAILMPMLRFDTDFKERQNVKYENEESLGRINDIKGNY